MKKILLGLVLLFFINLKAAAEIKYIYCVNILTFEKNLFSDALGPESCNVKFKDKNFINVPVEIFSQITSKGLIVNEEQKKRNNELIKPYLDLVSTGDSNISGLFNRILDPIEGRWLAIQGAEKTFLEIRKDGLDKFVIIYEHNKDKFTLPINKGAGGLYFGFVDNDKGKGTIETRLVNINRLYFKISAKSKFGAEESKQVYLNRTFPSDFAAHNSKHGKSPSTSKEPSSDAKGYSGTAFFINMDGYLITNHHVVKDCENKSKISYKNKDVSVKFIASDPNLDLALLKADLKNNSSIKISNKNPEKLQKVIAAGYPLGKRLSDDLKVTSGIISSLKGLNDNSNQIQIDASLNQGNSGGPIVDEKTGELVAVAVSALKSDKIDSINFGIKSDAVVSFLKSNKVKENSSTLFSSGNTSVIKKLEESVVYTYCRI